MTGLIYVAIVALWAAVLIPMWLRRHDADEAHRLERHQQAMGILARFRGGDVRDWSPARQAARRRRTILITLIAVTVAGGAAWLLQVAGAWVVVLPGLALAGFVAMAAWATRAQAADATRERAAAERTQRREQRQRVERTPRRRVSPTMPAAAPAALDRVFDQTA